MTFMPNGDMGTEWLAALALAVLAVLPGCGTTHGWRAREGYGQKPLGVPGESDDNVAR